MKVLVDGREGATTIKSKITGVTSRQSAEWFADAYRSLGLKNVVVVAEFGREKEEKADTEESKEGEE